MAIALASSASAQGIFQIHKITGVTDADTLSFLANPTAFWAVGTSNPSTQASTGVHVTESSGTYTFYPGEDAITVTLFIVP